jgi:hypothetical protein
VVGELPAHVDQRAQPSLMTGRAGPLPRGVDFARINAGALGSLPRLLSCWLPKGRCEGHEYVALNPRRADRSLGSFRINLESGRWADFAIEGARGGDPVSLVAYIDGVGQAEAARRIVARLGL